MGNWITLRPTQFNHPRTMNIGGVPSTVFLSPYDVPDGLRGSFDQSRQCLTIEFRYMGSEEPLERVEENRVDEHTVAVVGKSTGRLYKITVNLAKIGADRPLLVKVPTEIDAAFGRLAHSSFRPAKIENYEVSREVVSNRIKDLFNEPTDKTVAR